VAVAIVHVRIGSCPRSAIESVMTAPTAAPTMWCTEDPWLALW
jgi:hypothetical protein